VTTFIVAGEPVPKARPRFTVAGGKPIAYTPTRTRDAELDVAQAFRIAARGVPPLTGRVSVEIDFHFSRNRGKGHDVDNLSKTVLDALNGLAYADDSQVVHLDAAIFDGSPASHTTVRVQEDDS